MTSFHRRHNLKKKKKFLLISGIVLAVAAAGAFGYRAIAGRAAASSDLRTGLVSTGTVSTTISGSGSVRSRQNAIVSWQTSGTVDAVSVQMGQNVQTGDNLASLDPSTISTGIIQAQSDLIDAQNAYEELLKPDPLKIAKAQIAVDDAKEALANLHNPTDAALAEAELAVINAQSTADDAQAVVDRLKYGRASDEMLASAKAGYLLAQQKVDQMQQLYDDTGGDPETDASKALALTNLESAKTEMRKALGSLNWYQGMPTEEEIAEKKAALAVALAALQTTKDNLEKLKSPTAEDIALAEATLADAQEALDTAKVGATEDELTIARTRVTIAEAEVAKMGLTAPFSGTVTSISTLSGDIVNQTQSAFRIDDMSSLYIDLSISEVDILQVKNGQDAAVTFDAISDKAYTGKVVQIGMAASSSQGVVNYPVTVQITNPDESILPGMTASVDIVIEEHADVMVVPSSAIRTTAGQRTVTVLYEGQQISVPVTVGLTSNSMTEVSSESLKVEDVVVLNTSTASSTSNNANNQFDPREGGAFIINGDNGSFQGPPGGGVFP